MSSSQKTKKRGKNFTKQEEVVLVDLVEDYKHIIENKKSDAVTWRQKEQGWEALAAQFRAKTGVHREWKALRDKFDNMKRRTKTDLAGEKRETYRTGGGTSTHKVENVSLRIASILDTSGSGMNNPHDDDMDVEILDEETANVDVSIVEEKENDNTLDESSQTGHDWASWNPANLRQKKSDELCVVKGSSRKRNMEEEKMKLVLLQQEFYRGENTRAAEKHELEKLHAEEKHQQELINLQLKNQLLELELNEKIAKYSTKSDNNATVDNFVDEIRKAAEQAQNLNGFVYEPTSGLYYDQKTGYYYNAEYGLYYDGNNGCYYNYNQEKNQFEFHSQVQTQEIQKSAEDDIADANEEMVEFDEFGGVITDQERIRKIKEERIKEEEEKRAGWRKKKKPKDVKTTKKSAKKMKRKHKSKKRKHSRRKYARSSTDSSTTSESESDDERKKPRIKRERKSDDEKKTIRIKRERNKSCDVMEDGKLTDRGSKSSESDSGSSDSWRRRRSTEEEACERKKVATFSTGEHLQDIAKKYPPSLRIIVQESNLDSLKVGSLSLITYKGGSLGREGDHDVIIPDVNVSKTHMKFHYDHRKSIYKCIDLGSRNGTVLNGTRMSAAKQESLEYDLVHGSVLQIGQTKLLCHVHEGNTTCGLCEPGLLIESTRESAAASSGTVALTHREQLKKLQKKYGLENEKFVEAKQTVGNYNDRAATRRIKIGSSTDGEKTQTASVNTEIPSENKGFKMLSKLGWNKGETLGKATDGSGLLEPINVSSNEGKKGLGCELSTPSSLALSQVDKRKIATWKKTQERYKQTDIFGDSGESS